MGVCCIVFDIDGMLFEFCIHVFFLILKNIKFKFFFFQNFMFSSRFMLFPTLKKKLSKKFLFLENNSFSFHVLYYFQH